MHKFSKHKSNFVKDGFCLIESFLSPAELKKLSIIVKKFIKYKSSKLTGKNINYADKDKVNTLHDVDKFDSKFKTFALKKKYKDLAKIFLDEEADLRKCEIFAKPAKTGLAAPMHQDNALWSLKNNKGITFWIALEKSNKKNGALKYIVSSHKLGLLKHEDSYMPGTSQKVSKDIYKKKFSNSKIVSPELKPGDMLIHHCLTLHGSSPNHSSKSRIGFTMQFKGIKDTYDVNQLRRYEKNLIKQIKSRIN
tara:strand:+ start:89 stop:838 length:750 start_codon:yes stop_codon:yes gene_type:complete